MRNRIVLLAVVIGLLVGAAGVGLLVVTDDDQTTVAANLPKLPIGAFGERTAAAAADSMLAGPVEWRVRGELPELDDHATAYELQPPSAKAKDRLVAAFPADLSVRVAPDGSWNGPASDAGDCTVTTREGPPDAPVGCASGSSGVATASAVAVACAPDQPCKPPPPPADLPSESEARQIALRTFERAGIDTSGSVQLSGPDYGWNVTTEPRVGGRRVVNLGTTMQIGSKGSIVSAGGRLIDPDAIGDYPLVTTSKGFERLKEQWGAGPGPLRGGPEPAIAIAPGEPAPDGGPGQPPQPIVRTITGVTLGLLPTFGTETTYLAPVFLFETDDGAVVPVPAVVDELLEQPGGGGTPEPAPVPVPAEPPQQVPPAPPSAGGGSEPNSGACAGSSSAASSSGGESNQSLTLEVCASPSNVRVGETVTFTLKASDPDAAMDADGCQQPTAGFGDETDQTAHCMSICSRETFPPEATTLGRTWSHAYAKPGTYTARFTADSCAPKASHGQAELQIVVRP
jgi:hypothetical protein